MDDALIGTAIVVGYVVLLALFWVAFDRHWRRRDAEYERRQAERDAEHETHMAELDRQRYLHQLETRRLGLLRGREHHCRFCGVEEGCLNADDVCMDVEACMERGQAREETA